MTYAASRVAATPAGASAPMVVANDLSRDYPMGDGVVHALRSVDLAVGRGELLAVRGRSGSGKTTLLNLLGGLDRPTAGRVLVDGIEISSLSEDRLVSVRRKTVAFVFQAFGLVPFLTAAENVEVPLRLVHAAGRERDERVAELLEMVGLAERARHRPHELSGGEQQRVALARAFVVRPKLLLADEPTGSLDAGSGDGVIELLFGMNREYGTTLVMVTHDESLAARCHRRVRLSGGRVVA